MLVVLYNLSTLICKSMSIMDGVDSLRSRRGIYAVVNSSYVREVNGLNKPDAESFP
jgi:hypothetical protein